MATENTKYLDKDGLSTFWGIVKGKFVPMSKVNTTHSLSVSLNTSNDIDTGGGVLITANTGTAFKLWLHDVSNVWYKQTSGGSWVKMNAGTADYVPWSGVTGKPTALSGFGITDGVNSVEVGGSGNAVTAASISGHKLTLTKGSSFALSGHTHDYLVTNKATADTFNASYHNLQALYAGGDNGIEGRPSNVDAFGLIRLRVAEGWSGQILLANGGDMYIRSALDANLTKSLAWKRIIDSGNIGSQSVNYATSAGKVSNALSWSGYSSGSYDGSSAKSISIPNNTNQLTNGAGFITSSGSISGNAATATSATVLSKNANFNDGAVGRLSYYDADISNTTNNAAWSAPSKGWHQIIHNDLSVANYFTELAFPVNDVNGLAWRQRRSGSYFGWYRILDSNNYNSYAPTKTGTGASGTWGISISGNAATATKVSATVAGGSTAELVRGNMADNDQFRILVGGTSNAGYAEIATADDASEPIYVRQYSGTFTTLKRTATLLDGSGNTTFPGTVTASSFSGDLSGNATSATFAAAATSAASATSADKLDGYHASELLSALSNTSNGISITVGGTTKSIANMSVNYAATAGSANGVAWGNVSGKPSSYTPASHNHGLLHSDFTQQLENTTTDGGWSMLNSTYNGYLLKSLRTQANAPSWILGNYSAGIVFGGSDTKGVLSVSYASAATGFKIAGGNSTKPVWWMQIHGTSAKDYNLDSFITSSSSISGNAATATKLATSRTIWGQNFDGSGNVSGLLTATIGSHHSGVKLGDAYLTAIGKSAILENLEALRFGTDDWDWSSWAGLSYVKDSKTINLGVPDGSVFNYNGTVVTGGTLHLPGITKLSSNGDLNIEPTGNVGIATASPDATLHVTGTAHISSNTTIDGTLNVKGNGLELYYHTPYIDFHYGNTPNDYDVRIINNVSGGLQINAKTLVDIVGPTKTSGGRLWVTSGNTNILNATTSLIEHYVKAKFDTTSWFVGSVGIGTDAVSTYKLKVQGAAYVSGNMTINGNCTINGTINNGDFSVDGDGWVFTPQLVIGQDSDEDGQISVYDADGEERIFNLQKAIELGIFT